MLRAVFCQDGKPRSAATVFKGLEYNAHGNLPGEALVANFEQEIKIRVKFRQGPNGSLIARDYSLVLEAFRQSGADIPSVNTRPEFLYEELCRNNIPLTSYFLDKRNEGAWDTSSIITLPLKKGGSPGASPSAGTVRFQIRFQELFEETLGDKLVGMVVAHKTAKQIKEEVSHGKPTLRVEQELTDSIATAKSESSSPTDPNASKTLERRSLTSRSLKSLITGASVPQLPPSTSPNDKLAALELRCEMLEKALGEAREGQAAARAEARAKEVQLAEEAEALQRRCAELERAVESMRSKMAQFHWERDKDHDMCMNDRCRAEFTFFNRRCVQIIFFSFEVLYESVIVFVSSFLFADTTADCVEAFFVGPALQRRCFALLVRAPRSPARCKAQRCPGARATRATSRSSSASPPLLRWYFLVSRSPKQ